MTEFKAGERVIFDDPNKENNSWHFTAGQVYTVGGKYHKPEYGTVGVVSDNHGQVNGHSVKFFKVYENDFFSWWNRYYPQEYGHNAEFRNIVERHARAAFEAGKNVK